MSHPLNDALQRQIDHFTVVCLVAWPLNESEAGVDLVLIETLLLFICKFLLISMRTAWLTLRKAGRFLSKQGHLQATKQETVKWSIDPPKWRVTVTRM